MVVAIIALASGVSMLALRGGARDRLEQEAARLSAVLDAARLESRASGRTLIWVPASPTDPIPPGEKEPRADFRFEQLTPLGVVGFNAPKDWPRRWLHAQTSAEVIGAARLVLGPEPLIPAQRVRLRLQEEQIDLATDGLSAFRVESGGSR